MVGLALKQQKKNLKTCPELVDHYKLKLLTTKNSEGVILSSYQYELDNTGRRESITEQDGRYTNYTYDNLYRLTDETIKQSIDATTVDHSANYQYDWVGIAPMRP